MGPNRFIGAIPFRDRRPNDDPIFCVLNPHRDQSVGNDFPSLHVELRVGVDTVPVLGALTGGHVAALDDDRKILSVGQAQSDLFDMILAVLVQPATASTNPRYFVGSAYLRYAK